MKNRPYSECLDLAMALVGVPDSNATEVSRMKAFLNRRARRAYDESPFWPRYYVAGEERIVSEEGLLPYEQENLSTIKTCLRIHKTDPYKVDYALEYTSFIAESDGVQIANYEPSFVSSGAPMRVTPAGDYIIPNDAEGIYEITSDSSTGQYGATLPIFRKTDNTNYALNPQVLQATRDSLSVYWRVLTQDPNSLWRAGPSFELVYPDEIEGYAPEGSAFGDITVTKVDTYSAYVTYTAAFEETYGEGEGETSDVPAEWFDYMAHGGAADFLRAEKEYEAAALMDADAWNYLVPQLESVSRMGGSHAKTRVLTHANMQSR